MLMHTAYHILHEEDTYHPEIQMTGRLSQFNAYTQYLFSMLLVITQAVHNYMGWVHAGHVSP